MARSRRRATGKPRQRWKPIPGFPLYEVSDWGRVRSYKGSNQNSPPRTSPKSLKIRIGDGGYPRVTLQNAMDKKQVVPVHLLVARAFLGPSKGRVVRHLDGDRENPRLSNLEYGTQAENNEDKRGHGTLLMGEDNLASMVTAEEAVEIYRLKGEMTQQEIADEFGVSRQAVSDIHRGITWAHKTGHKPRRR